MPKSRASRVQRHRVTFTTADREVGKAPMSFVVRRGNRVVGTMRVRRGGVEWFPRKTRFGYKFSWEAFARQLAKS